MSIRFCCVSSFLSTQAYYLLKIKEGESNQVLGGQIGKNSLACQLHLNRETLLSSTPPRIPLSCTLDGFFIIHRTCYIGTDAPNICQYEPTQTLILSLLKTRLF